MRLLGLVGAILISAISVSAHRGAGCGPERPPPKEVPRVDPFSAVAAASGTFTWTIGQTTHSLHAGAALVGVSMASMQLRLADAPSQTACGNLDERDDYGGHERIDVDVPRGIDVPFSVGTTVSPDPILLHPFARAGTYGGARFVTRYSLRIESIEWKTGGRVVGTLSWSPHASSESSGSGRFDLPLCVVNPKAPPKPRSLSPSGTVQGTTRVGPFTSGKALAFFGPYNGNEPYVHSIGFFPDPQVSCATYLDATSFMLRVHLDGETGRGARNGTRQPVHASCVEDHHSRGCAQGFVDLSSLSPLEAKPGGSVRGTVALGEGGFDVQGEFDAVVCAE
jgi:hypothetical protein